MWLQGLGLSYETGVSRLESLRSGYETERSYAARSGRIFATFDDAVATNQKEMLKNDRSARNIVRRHMRELEGGFQVIHDERQKARGFGGWRCGVVFSEAVNATHLAAIQCPVLLVSADREADGGAMRRTEENLAQLKDGTRKMVKGLHHVHSDRPAAVAGGLVLPWLAEKLGGAESAKL